MKDVLVFPILVPLLTAVVSLFFWRRPQVQKVVGLVGSSALLGIGGVIFYHAYDKGILATQIGGWPAPHGITLAADLLSALLVLMTGFLLCLISVVSLTEVDHGRESFGYYPLLQVLTMGICGSFLTGDIFNLYVWFEVMLMASFVLLGLGGERPQLEGTIKYVTLNLLSSALFLAGIGVLYGTFGTLNMADLALQLRTVQQPAMGAVLSMLFLLAFGIKAAVFPLFFWLPASYHTPPVPVSAIFAGLLTKVGIYSLVRFFSLIFTRDLGHIRTLILIVSALTMGVGILGAIVQKDFRRIAAYNLISHIGYILTGLGLFSSLALVGSVFYLIHDMIAKTGLFLFSAVLQRLGGHSDITRLGGFARSNPYISCLFLSLALAISGIPPLSGFWGKLILIQAGLLQDQAWVAAAILATSLLTLYSMVNVWSEVFWKDAPSDTPIQGASDGGRSPVPRPLLSSVAILALLTILMGMGPEPLYNTAKRVAYQLQNPDLYIQAILGEKP